MWCGFRSFKDCVPAVRGGLRNRQSNAGIPLSEKAKTFAFGMQVHGNQVARAEGRKRIQVFDATDGVVSGGAGVRVAVLSADCLPVLIAVPGKKPAVAAVHAGWKGTEARIAKKAVAKLKSLTGADPRTYRVFLGPALRVCCYEVGPEFVVRFPKTILKKRNGSLRFDLPGENLLQLQEAGIARNHIHDSGLCTMCCRRDFYSFRREKEGAGRLISWISFSGRNDS